MRRVLKAIGSGLLFVVVGICLAIVILPKFLDRIYYRGAPTAHFDGAHFANPDGNDELAMPGGGSRGGFIWRYLTRSDGRPTWPDHVPVTPSVPAPRVEGQRMVATWVGHATVLVQTQGLNILTDPIWAATSGPFDVGPRRVAEPGIRLKDLPKIDLIVVSHNHYDHMDLGTIKRLWARDKPVIVTSLGNDTVIAPTGAKVVTRDWGGRVLLRPGIDVIVTRNHHWGSRWGVDRNRALWSSFVVTLPGGNLFFAGDTGFGDGNWPAEAAAHGPVRLALIPIGAFRFRPGQMGIGSHIGPIDAAEVYARLGASRAIAIHWGTFRLSSEGYDTPPKMLAEAMKCHDRTGFEVAAIGRPVEVAPYRQQPLSTARSDLAACLNRPAITSLR